MESITQPGLQNSTGAGLIYGSDFEDDYLRCNPASLPFYGPLGRKVMSHYLGDRYNPHLHGLTHEPFLRKMIKDMVAYKVLYRTAAYDWDWIDQSFKKYFSGSFQLVLPFDQARIDQGFRRDAQAAKVLDCGIVH